MMDSGQYGYTPDHLVVNPQVPFNNLWNSNDNHLFFTSNGAQPTQAAPFFQPSQSTFASQEKLFSQDGFFGVPKQSFPRQTNLQSRGITSTMVYRQAMMPPQKVRNPSVKRQRIGSPLTRAKAHQSAMSCETGDEPTKATSECCSSCPDGEICTESNCAPWDEHDIDQNAAGVVSCSRQSCAEEACPDPCLTVGIQNQKLYGPVEAESRVGNWMDSTWDPQVLRDMPSRLGQSVEGSFDPQLRGFEGAEYVSASASPAPTTPSMANNVDTPFSPNAGISTPHFTTFQQARNTYSNPSGNMLSGSSDIFNTPTDQWSNQFGQFSNDPSLFHCTWNGCGQTIMNSHDWLPHLHTQHIDPQMTFNCPIQEESCPPTITDNPLNHLQKDHGYNFDLGDGNIGCPDPTCVEGGEVFCNPAMLHHHFDNVHAIPNQGYLHCQLDTCDTFFHGFDQLLSHFVEDHQLPVAKDNDINLQLTAPVTRTVKEGTPSLITEQKASAVPEIPHTCKWKDQGSTCGKICTSEDDLQAHLKNDHLSVLDKSSGYRCQWEGCVREKARGEQKSGFSQRGKLERHMATHTNFKCCKCDVCGQTFSAQQSLAQHKLLHTGEKPWKCAHCGKAFPQQSALTIHERTHTGLKPLKCEICGKAFSESSNLAKHRKIHNKSGENVCLFPGCGKRFVRLDQLKRHGNVHRKGKMAMSEDGESTVVSMSVRSEFEESERGD